MDRRSFNKLLAAAAVAPLVVPNDLASAVPARVSGPRGRPSARRRWTLVADIAECCSCDIPCSCNFGRPERTCFGNRLIRIREGDIDGAPLAGITFVVAFHMRNWTRLYIDESLTAVQTEALDRLLPAAFAGFANQARTKERVPLAVEEGSDTFRFVVPDSEVQMRLLSGLDGGPIRITNLPNPAYHDYVQYESVVHRHASADGEWSYSGTNGFRSVMRASG